MSTCQWLSPARTLTQHKRLLNGARRRHENKRWAFAQEDLDNRELGLWTARRDEATELLRRVAEGEATDEERARSVVQQLSERISGEPPQIKEFYITGLFTAIERKRLEKDLIAITPIRGRIRREGSDFFWRQGQNRRDPFRDSPRGFGF